jgi:hypothetical protein
LSAAVGGSGQKWGNTYGLSPQFLESLWINGPLVARVFVANVSHMWLLEITVDSVRVMFDYTLVLLKQGNIRGMVNVYFFLCLGL